MRDIEEGKVGLEKDKVVIVQEDGTEKEYDVMFMFDCPQNGKSYVAFADNTVKSRNRDMYFVYYDTGAYTGALYPIEAEDEEICKNAMAEVEKQIRGK